MHSVLDFLVVTIQSNVMPCKTDVRLTSEKNYFCALKQAESVAFESKLITLFYIVNLNYLRLRAPRAL